MGKFPQVGVYNSRGPLADEELAVPFNDECDETAVGGFDTLAKVRKFLLQVSFSRNTEFVHRAVTAFR